VKGGLWLRTEKKKPGKKGRQQRKKLNLETGEKKGQERGLNDRDTGFILLM